MSETASDETLRRRLQKEADENGIDFLYEKLRAVDPKSAEEIHPNNVKRVIRALEIYYVTGTPKSEQITSQSEPAYDALIFSYDWERDVLYERINKRVDIMIENGLVSEVKALVENGLLNTPQSLQASQAIGYKELIGFIEGRETLAEAVEALKAATRRYAKRQITWFSGKQYVNRIDVCDAQNQKTFEEIVNIAEKLFFC